MQQLFDNLDPVSIKTMAVSIFLTLIAVNIDAELVKGLAALASISTILYNAYRYYQDQKNND